MKPYFFTSWDKSDQINYFRILILVCKKGHLMERNRSLTPFWIHLGLAIHYSKGKIGFEFLRRGI